MKVIKEGKWNEPWSTEVDCPTCEARLLVDEGDLKPYDNSQDFYVHCPLCAKIVPIKARLVSQRVRESAGAGRRYWSSDDSNGK